MSALSEEVVRLVTLEERHRRLFARIALLVLVTLVVDVIGTTAVYVFERHAKQTDVKSLFDAFFFTTTQLLTISSSVKNPLTTGGKIVDMLLELWGVLAIAGSAGALASFFQSGDK